MTPQLPSIHSPKNMLHDDCMLKLNKGINTDEYRMMLTSIYSNITRVKIQQGNQYRRISHDANLVMIRVHIIYAIIYFDGNKPLTRTNINIEKVAFDATIEPYMSNCSGHVL